MAGKTAILAIRVLSDARQGRQGLEQTGRSAAAMSRELDKAGQIATRSAAVAGAAIAVLAVQAGKAAAEAEQATGAVAAAFGQHAAAIDAAAKAAPRAVGLSTRAYQQMAAVFGAQLRNMGVGEDQLAGQTQELIGLGADLSAMFGGTAADAVAALSSLLRGERDPIERYGISIKQATIDAKLAEQGLDGLTGAAKTQAETQAILSLLWQQAGPAVGTFGREVGTASGSMQIANAEWENAKVALGEVLLPIMVEGATKIADLSARLVEHRDIVIPVIGFIAGLAATVLAVKAATEVWTAATTIATAVQWAYNAALTANPIGLVIVAIGLLIGLIIVIIANWETLSAVASDVWGNIESWIDDANVAIEDFINGIWDAVQAIGSLFGSAPADLWTDPGMLAGMHIGVDYSGAPQGLAMSDTVGQWDESTRPAVFARLGGSAPRGGDTFVTNISGALDPVAVGRQVGESIDKYRRTTGRNYAGGRGWAV